MDYFRLKILLLAVDPHQIQPLINSLNENDWEIDIQVISDEKNLIKYLDKSIHDIILLYNDSHPLDFYNTLNICKEKRPFTSFILIADIIDKKIEESYFKLGIWDVVDKNGLIPSIKKALNLHNASEEFSNYLLHQFKISAIVINQNFEILHYNAGIERITGIDIKSNLGKNIFKVLKLKNEKGEDFDQNAENVKKLVQKSSFPQSLICNYSHPNGNELWFSISITHNLGSWKNVPQMTIFFQDITQKKEIENTLNELENRYETIFNSVSDGIFLYEPDEFKLIDINDRIVEMFEYSKDDLKSMHISDLSFQEEGFTNRRGILYAISAISGEVEVHEWFAKSKSGKKFWTLLLLKKVIVGGRSVLMGIIKDIDVQKKAELSLHESEEHFRALAQNSPDVIMRFDSNFRHLYVNDAIRNILSIEPDEFINKTHEEMGLFSSELSDFWQKSIKNVFDTGKPYEVEFSLDSHGKKIIIEWRLFPEYNSKGKTVAVLTVARDITERKVSQNSLKKSEEQLQMALEATRDGMWDWDIINNQIFFSPRYFTMLGYNPDEFEHTLDTIYKLLHPDDRSRFMETYNNITSIILDNIEMELRLKRKDGSFAWILSRGKVFAKDEQGCAIRIVGTNEDITEKKRQDEIRNILVGISESVNTTGNLEEFFESIRMFLGRVIETRNCYISLYDKNTRTITLPFLRDEKDKFKEFPAGKTLTEYVLLSGKSQLLNYQKINDLKDAGEIEIIGSPAISWLGVPLRIKNELIGLFVVQSYDEEIQFSADDVQIIEYVSDQIAIAIARKKDQDKILENQNRQRQIIESSPDGLIVTDRNGVIIDHNSRIIDLLNIKSTSLINRNLKEFISAVDENKLAKIFNYTLSTGFKKQEDIKMRREDGVEFFAEISLGLIKNTNNNPEIQSSETYVITIKNIDERKEYEANLKIAKIKAEESDRLKTAFLSNMSHEIRTPMNAIIGFAELLSQGDISEEDNKEFISQINFGAESLMRLMDDIIDIAKIEAGQLKIYNSYFNLSDILNDLKVMFSKALYRQNKQHLGLIEENGSHNPDIQMFGDQIRIRQIFINLISNAIKFTESGEIRFGIKDINNGFIYFYVQDSGIGIPFEKLDIIFDRFRQANEESNTKVYGGTGLGLAISKNLVELMGGTISVQSEKERGSVFSFSIPFNSFEAKIKEAEVISLKKLYNWEDKTVLIAEDEISNFVLLKAVLKNSKIKILWAKDGKEVIDIFESNPEIDIILMDIQLPFMNGYEASRIIKSKRKEVPIIAQTAYAMSGERQKSEKAGCDDYIAKPIQVNELLAIMSKYINR